MTNLIHTPCYAACESLGGPEPSDPDRHGNKYETYSCSACGERGSVMFFRHRGYQTPKEFVFEDDLRVEW